MSAGVLDLLAAADAGYRDLYYRWEKEQWEAGKIGLSEDAAGWSDLDPIARRRCADAINWRRMRAERATTALVAFVDAAPTEEQQVFLTTQLVDEARGGVFLDRVASEVLEQAGGDMEGRSAAVMESLDPGVEGLLSRTPGETSERLRRSASPRSGLVEAMAAYHLAVVGVLGLTEGDALLGSEVLRTLPGLHEGLTMMQRDAARHVAFALLFLEEEAGSGAGRRALEEGLASALPGALETLGAAADAAPGAGEADELRLRARADLAAWLKAVKLGVPAFA